MLRSTEKFPDANLEEKACSESFPRRMTCYLMDCRKIAGKREREKEGIFRKKG